MTVQQRPIQIQSETYIRHSAEGLDWPLHQHLKTIAWYYLCDILEDPSKFYKIIMIVPYQFEIWMHAYVFKVHLYDWVLIIVIDNTSKACKSRKFSKGGGGAEG